MATVSNTSLWTPLNPPIYLVSILPGVGVWLLTRPVGPALYSLIAATVAVVLLQHAINLLNDVSDWRLGADVEKADSWVRYHDGNSRVAAIHGWLGFVAGGLLGLAVLDHADRFWILLIALPMVALGYLYNSGQRPLSYTRFGEWVTGLCYGPGVVGCLWLLIGEPVTATAVLAMIAFAALAMALLLSHQPPQIATDRAAGKHSFAVRFGAAMTMATSRALFGLFVLCVGAAVLAQGAGVLELALVCSALMCAIGFIVATAPAPKRLLINATGVIGVLLVSQLVAG